MSRTGDAHVRLVTFADGSLRWRLAGRRLERQAKKSGWFGSIHRWTRKTLHNEIPQFRRENPELDMDGTRGFGYWLWRSYILMHELQSLNEGETLLFLDAGCQVNASPVSKIRFQQYLLEVRSAGNLIMEIDAPLSQWCKQDLVLQFVTPEQARAMNLVEPGVFFLARNTSNAKLLDEWITWSRARDYHYLDDSPSITANAADFQEHRHDQAILTCLGTRHDLHTIAQETYFPEEWRGRGQHFPVWALRNSLPCSLYEPTPWSRLMTRLYVTNN